MRITTRITWDADWNVLEHEYFEYSGEVSQLKDHGQDAAATQQKRDNALQDQQLARQNAVQDQIKAATNPYVSNGGEGFTPEEIAAMRSTMMNGVAANYQTAGKSVRSALLARGAGGGDQPVGGDYTKGITGLESGLANESAEGQLGITRANAQQRLSNMFNSFNSLNGVASTDAGNVGVFGQGASSALNNYMQAKAIPGFGQILGNSFASALGNTLGGGNVSTSFSR